MQLIVWQAEQAHSTGAPVATGTLGEVRFHGPHLFRGYWNSHVAMHLAAFKVPAARAARQSRVLVEVGSPFRILGRRRD